MRPLAASSGFLVLLALVASAQENEKKKPAFKVSADEQKLLELTNAERKNLELPPLKPNPILFQLAREHSRNMAKQETLNHELDCKTPFDRMKEANYEYRRAGENIAYSGGETTLADILKGWMESEGHRANILHEGYTEIGLGIAKNDKGEVYYTQVFGTPLRRQ
jgi:uncharacterized protein YkwD